MNKIKPDDEPCLTLSVQQLDLITQEAYERGYKKALEENNLEEKTLGKGA